MADNLLQMAPVKKQRTEIRRNLTKLVKWRALKWQGQEDFPWNSQIGVISLTGCLLCSFDPLNRPPPQKKHWQGSTSANGARHVAETRTADAPVEPRNVRLSTSSPVANVYLVCLNAPLTVKDISNIIISSSGCRLIFCTSSSTEKMTLDYMLQVLTDGWTWGRRIHLNKSLISLLAAPNICLQLLNVNWASFFQLNKQLSVKESQF